MVVRRSPWKWVLLGVLVGAAIYWGPKLMHSGPAPAGDPSAMGGGMPANVASVVAKNVTRWSEFSGRIEAVNAAEIRPQVGGQVTKVHFKDGELIKRGEPLFTIDARPYEAQLQSAKGAFVEAKSSYARAKKLVAMKAVSQAEFETRQGAYEQALGNYQSAQVNLGYTHIAAPLTGRISRAEITEGNLVEAGPNAPLLASIVSLSPLYASFELDEQTFLSTIQGVPREKLKQVPVEVGLSNDEGTPYKAVIHSFDNQLTAGSGTIRVRAKLENKDESLVPGLFARIRLGTPEETPTLLVNPSAIGTDQNKKFVLVMGEGNKAEYREVKIGEMVDGLQVVTSGVKEGDKIIVSNLQKLRPGVPVTPIEADMTTLQPIGGPTTDAKP